MIKFFIAVFALSLLASLCWADDNVDWSDPPVMCTEDVVNYFKTDIAWAKKTINNPSSTAQDILRAKDIFDATHDLDRKIDLIYESANKRGMPPQFLLSILMIENNFLNDGLSHDGGNYSCGLTQINVFEFCKWAQTLDPKHAKQIQWPLEEIAKVPSKLICSTDVPHKPVELMMNEVMSENPKQEMNRVDLKTVAKIPFEKIKDKMEGSDDLKMARYKATLSFLKHCRDPKYGIPALAEVLFQLHQNLLADMRNTNFYKPGEKPPNTCKRKSSSPYYPISTSWLIAGATYNAGEFIVPGFEKYKPKPWSEMLPSDLVSLVEFIPTTGELFTKSPLDWQILNYYVRSIINYSAPPDEPIVDEVPYPHN